MNPNTASAPHPSLAGITVLERGWLSSNNILIHAAAGEAGAVLVDTGHLAHTEQTVALVRQALAGQPLARIINTHLHTDHCGGNAALAKAFGAPITIGPGLADAVRAWDTSRMGHDSFGQRERFELANVLHPGEHFVAGGRHWQAHAAPGHDPDSLIFFEPEARVLISADALWSNGFGVVFGELLGEGGFDETAATLKLIEALNPAIVIPGHGAPFTDVADALARARSRLAYFAADAKRHAQYGVKVLLKYHLMAVRQQPLDDLLRWATSQPFLHVQSGQPGTGPGRAWIAPFVESAVQALAHSGALRLDKGIVHDV